MAGLDFSSAAAGENYTERHDNDDGSYCIHEYSHDGRLLCYTFYGGSDGSIKRIEEYDVN